MITTTTYSQLDGRWADKYIGKTRQKIRDYGCTITSICNLLNSQGYNETPESVNMKMTLNGGYIGALVIWSAVTRIWPNVKFKKRAYNYNNIEISFYIYAKRIPVLVEVYNPLSPVRRHWVLYVGDRKMVDPLGGVIRSTSTFSATGYTLYDR